ncbi:MAG TPA: hypothetical protein DCP90_07830 [Clostridiales bacterium]|nr:MAG: hypothetical protein A2Y22_06025 [Clostridiales bacterium GWD2_32_59]HAN10508.1 hypothetical protein [Clostridiales bacterium]
MSMFNTMGYVETKILDYIVGEELREICEETVGYMTENKLMFAGVVIFGEADSETVVMILQKITEEAIKLDVGEHEGYIYYKENKRRNQFATVEILKDADGFLVLQRYTY